MFNKKKKKKKYLRPVSRKIPLFAEKEFCVISKWNDGHGGSDDVIDNPDDPLPDAGGKEWGFDDENDGYIHLGNVWDTNF